MVDAYAKLIMLGRKTINDVPDKLREQVRKRLEDAGLTRLKASTAVYKAVESGFLSEIYYDRESIQINSIKKENKLWDILEDIGMSLDEFKINVLGLER